VGAGVEAAVATLVDPADPADSGAPAQAAHAAVVSTIDKRRSAFAPPHANHSIILTMHLFFM
jgi:hypothetical protein